MLLTIGKRLPYTNTPLSGNNLFAGSGQSVDATIASIPNMIQSDDFGYTVIKGVGTIIGGSNPSNNTPDELILVNHKPLITETTELLFSKVFTSNTNFDFEITLRSNSTAKITFSDGTVVIKQMTLTSAISDLSQIIAFRYGSVSGLYTISIVNFYSEYVSNKN